MIKDLADEIKKYKLDSYCNELIHEKDGIVVSRLRSGSSSFVLKYFGNPEYRRELDYYKFFSSVDIKHIEVVARTEKSILLEDINASSHYRLGTKEDFKNQKVIKALAGWYRLLHEKGKNYIEGHDDLYSEWDHFTKENIMMLGEKFRLADSDGYKLLIEHYNDLEVMIREAPRTLIYHDFYYSNMVVSYDESEAFMFDYNLVGAGCYITDIRNVIYWFNEENKKYFLKEYGNFDEKLNLLEEIISPVVTLVIAVLKNTFPSWAKESKEQIESHIASKITTLIQ